MNLPAAPLRRPFRIPFPLLAAAAGLLFVAVGIAVVDDYGITIDDPFQRRHAEQNVAYLMGDRDALPGTDIRFYGIALELPLLLAERLLGLQDSRDIYLFRHLITHLFFIVGAFFAGCWPGGCSTTAGSRCWRCCCFCSIPVYTPIPSLTVKTFPLR